MRYEVGNNGNITEYPDAPVVPQTQDEMDAIRLSEIDARLNAIDIESVRPLRAINNTSSTQFDLDKLASLDSEAATLRIERATLT